VEVFKNSLLSFVVILIIAAGISISAFAIASVFSISSEMVAISIITLISLNEVITIERFHPETPHFHLPGGFTLRWG